MAKKDTSTTKLTSAQIEMIRQAMGIGPEVPDADIAELMSTPEGQKAIEHIESQPTGGGFGGFLHAGLQALYDINPRGSHAVAQLVRNLNQAGAKPKPKDPKKAAAPSGKMTEEQALQQLASILATNAYDRSLVGFGEAGQNLAQQNQYVTSLVDQQMQAAGAASGSPAVSAAMDAYTKAYSTGEAINSAAYQNMGLANESYVASSPYASILPLVTQLGSGQYKELPPSLVSSLPASVQQILAQQGITETTGTGEGTPIPITGAKNNATNTLNQAIAGLNLTGTTPATNPLISQTLTPGNPNVPGG